MDFSSLTLGSWIMYALIGRLLMFLWLKQPLSGYLSSRVKFLSDMFECPLCLGVWAYWALAIIFHYSLFAWYIPVVSEFMLGSLTSFIVWLFEMGWKERFTTIVIE